MRAASQRRRAQWFQAHCTQLRHRGPPAQDDSSDQTLRALLWAVAYVRWCAGAPTIGPTLLHVVATAISGTAPVGRPRTYGYQ